MSVTTSMPYSLTALIGSFYCVGWQAAALNYAGT